MTSAEVDCAFYPPQMERRKAWDGGGGGKGKIWQNSLMNTGEKPFRCDECNKLFKSSFYFEKYLKVFILR